MTQDQQPSVTEAWNKVRAEARELAGIARPIARLLAAVEAYGTACVADARAHLQQRPLPVREGTDKQLPLAPTSHMLNASVNAWHSWKARDTGGCIQALGRLMWECMADAAPNAGDWDASSPSVQNRGEGETGKDGVDVPLPLSDEQIEAMAREDAGGALLDWTMPENLGATAVQRAAFRRGVKAALAAGVGACPKCAQTDKGQTGEYPCSECGLPTVWDEEPTAGVEAAARAAPPSVAASNTERVVLKCDNPGGCRFPKQPCLASCSLTVNLAPAAGVNPSERMSND